jgi:hypothetical protein
MATAAREPRIAEKAASESHAPGLEKPGLEKFVCHRREGLTAFYNARRRRSEKYLDKLDKYAGKSHICRPKKLGIKKNSG